MARFNNRRLAALVIAGSALALAGCSGPAGYAALDRDAEPSDALPEELPAHALEDVDEGSARHIGTDEGTDLRLLRAEHGSEVCVLAYPDAVDWVMGCGGEGAVTIDGPAGSFAVQPDGATPPTDATRISDNVFRL